MRYIHFCFILFAIVFCVRADQQQLVRDSEIADARTGSSVDYVKTPHLDSLDDHGVEAVDLVKEEEDSDDSTVELDTRSPLEQALDALETPFEGKEESTEQQEDEEETSALELDSEEEILEEDSKEDLEARSEEDEKPNLAEEFVDISDEYGEDDEEEVDYENE